MALASPTSIVFSSLEVFSGVVSSSSTSGVSPVRYVFLFTEKSDGSGTSNRFGDLFFSFLGCFVVHGVGIAYDAGGD